MLTGSMSGANMHLVTVNVKLGENDPEPEQKLDPVSHAIPPTNDFVVLQWPNRVSNLVIDYQGEHIIKRVVALQDLQSTLAGKFFTQCMPSGLM